MNPHCECPMSGYCTRHKMHKGPEQHKRCQGLSGTKDCGLKYWQAWEQGKCGATAPDSPVLEPETFCSKLVSRSQVGTKLGEIIKRETGVEIPCEQCRETIQSLDSMTVDVAKTVREKIVAEIVSRAPQQASVWQSILIGADKLLHTGILRSKVKSWFDEAIATGADPVVQPIKKKVDRVQRAAGRRSQRKPYTGWRGEQDGPRLYMGPFVEPTVRHLTYHIWPTKRSDCWRWNLEQLAQRFDLFNGIKCVGIVTDKDTETVDDVLSFAESLGITFDRVEAMKNNVKLREVVTWLPMLKRLDLRNADETEVVFSAHAKGTQYENGSFTRDWTRLMYESCLDYWPLVSRQLQSSLMTGSFREFGLLGKWHDWAYSGTFYWWRAREIGQRKWMDVDQWFAGTESWPGKMCDPRETQCLFLNNNTRLYVPEYWQETVWPEWAKWQEKMRLQRRDYANNR